MKIRHLLQTAILTGSLCLVASAQTDRVPAGAEITVRTNDNIDAKSSNEGKIYNAVVDRDVRDSSGRVVVPKGSDAELVVREASKNSLVVDLQAVNVNGRRYIVSSPAESVGTENSGKEGVGKNSRTAKYVGGGAAIGSIIGAIAGGGKGAAIGAATGAGAGALGQTVTKGSRVRVPSESLLTFRLNRPLSVNDPGRYGNGYSRRDR